MALDSTTLSLSLTSGETTAVGLVTNRFPLSYTFSPTALTDGTSANNAQKVVTLSTSTDGTGVTYDLNAISGGPGNAAVNFTAVKLMLIENTHASQTLTVGNAASNQWTGWISSTTATVTIGPGGCLCLFRPDGTGMATSGSSKDLKIVASGAGTTYKLILIGEGS